MCSHYHVAGIVTSQNEVPQLRLVGSPSPAHLDPTIYRSDAGAVISNSGPVGTGSNSLDMLSVAIKIQLDETSATNLKVCTQAWIVMTNMQMREIKTLS